jgi:hypothetical protein
MQARGGHSDTQDEQDVQRALAPYAHIWETFWWHETKYIEANCWDME